jgi:hypothetical protein
LPNSRFWASAAEDHAAQLIAEALDLFRVGRLTEALCEFEEVLLFTLVRFDPVFDQLYQHAIGAEAAAFRDPSHLGRHACGEADALAHRLCRCLHVSSMHQNGAVPRMIE